MAIYTITWKGQKVISDDAPVMLLDSEDDVIRHRKIMETGTTSECFPKKDLLKVAV